jgi:MerR family transcriptional regulator, redox-sensitive transcriptional activator SoxR
MTEEMTIGEVARRAGIRPSAIRYYESMHVLPPPRLVNTKRRYTAEIFSRLTLIRIAQEAGLTIDEMRLVLNNQQEGAQYPGGWRALARQKLVEVEQRMQQTARMKCILEEALHQDLSAEEAIRLFRPLYPGDGSTFEIEVS